MVNLMFLEINEDGLPTNAISWSSHSKSTIKYNQLKQCHQCSQSLAAGAPKPTSYGLRCLALIMALKKFFIQSSQFPDFYTSGLITFRSPFHRENYGIFKRDTLVVFAQLDWLIMDCTKFTAWVASRVTYPDTSLASWRRVWP